MKLVASILAVSTLVAGAAAVPGAASALVADPFGTQVGAATDTLTITGVYTDPTGSEPFESGPFSLSYVIPQTVSISPSTSGTFQTTTGAGAYSNGHSVNTFSGANVVFTNSTGVIGNAAAPISETTLTVFDLFGSGYGEFQVSATTTPRDFYTLSNGGATGVVNTGLFPLIGGTASYAGDPNFTGTVTISANDMSSAAPEPSTWALTIAGLGMIGLTLRNVGRRGRASGRLGASYGIEQAEEKPAGLVRRCTI